MPSPIIRGMMQAENMAFTKKYKEITGPRIITDKTQKSRQIAEIPAMISNQPNSVILDTVWGQALSGLITVLEDKEYMVTLREKMNNIKKVAKFYNYDLLLAKK